MDPPYSAPYIKPIQTELLKENKCTRYSLLLAPFQPTTKIDLETVVNTSIECCLDIKNTGPKTLHVRTYFFNELCIYLNSYKRH